jgi:hypothetical protein
MTGASQYVVSIQRQIVKVIVLTIHNAGECSGLSQTGKVLAVGPRAPAVAAAIMSKRMLSLQQLPASHQASSTQVGTTGPTLSSQQEPVLAKAWSQFGHGPVTPRIVRILS